MKTTISSDILNDIINSLTAEDFALARMRLDVADAIYDAMTAKGLTYAETARLLDVPEDLVHDWTSGATDVPTDALCHIEAALHVTLTLPDSLYA